MNNEFRRKDTKVVDVGGVKIGGSNAVSIQSMTTTKTSDIKSTIEQLENLFVAGCEIARMSILDDKDAKAIGEISKHAKMPLVADIHFDHKLALIAMKNGINKIRINPGNIGSKQNVEKVVAMAKDKGVPIRIGVNSGSIEKSLLEKFKGEKTNAMVESALNHILILEKLSFENIVISAKSSSVCEMIDVYRKLSKIVDYPLHLGVTEAGVFEDSIIKSSIGIGTLLSEGIGDTIRVSISGEPTREVFAGKQILQAIGIRKGVEVISCPTCGRCQIDVEKIAKSVKHSLKNVEKNLTVAVMGCVVNGVGEGKNADIGIAGSKDKCVIFKKGEVLRRVDVENAEKELLKEVEIMIKG